MQNSAQKVAELWQHVERGGLKARKVRQDIW